jgi:hypothetical protein
MAKTQDPKSATEQQRREDRRVGDRRGAPDRRAFWRPTPDRRREATELGRREDDGTAGK